MGKISDFFSKIKNSVRSFPSRVKLKVTDLRALRIKKKPERRDVKLNQKNRRIIDGEIRRFEKQLRPLYLRSIGSDEIAQRRYEAALEKFDLKQSWQYRKVNHAYANALFAGKVDDEYLAEYNGELAALRSAREQKEKAFADARDKYVADHPFDETECRNAKAEYERELSKAQEEVDKRAAELREKRREAVEAVKSECNAKIDAIYARSTDTSALELSDDTVLSVKNLCMYFGGLHAVEDLSFDVKKGEIFGLIGPNGAGKTTVFNCITQFYKCTSGELVFRNNENVVINLKRKAVHDVILEGMARTFQNVEVIKELSVLENLLVASTRKYSSNLFEQALGLPILVNEEKLLKARATEILGFLDLLAYKDWLAWGLPYGVLKKVEIARALMANPKLLILDEPAAGLNNTETAQLAKLIVRIRDEFDCSILLVEHDMSLVMSICDRICAISFGKKLALGTPAEIQANKSVQEAYLGVDDGEQSADATTADKTEVTDAPEEQPVSGDADAPKEAPAPEQGAEPKVDGEPPAKRSRTVKNGKKGV